MKIRGDPLLGVGCATRTDINVQCLIYCDYPEFVASAYLELPSLARWLGWDVEHRERTPTVAPRFTLLLLPCLLVGSSGLNRTGTSFQASCSFVLLPLRGHPTFCVEPLRLSRVQADIYHDMSFLSRRPPDRKHPCARLRIRELLRQRQPCPGGTLDGKERGAPLVH